MTADRLDRAPLDQDRDALDVRQIVGRALHDRSEKLMLAPRPAAESGDQRAVPIEIERSALGPVGVEQLGTFREGRHAAARRSGDQLAIDRADLIDRVILDDDVTILGDQAVGIRNAVVEVDPPNAFELGRHRRIAGEPQLVPAPRRFPDQQRHADHDHGGGAAHDPSAPAPRQLSPGLLDLVHVFDFRTKSSMARATVCV